MSARDARSGSSRDFFFERRDLCTRWEDGAGLPPLMGELVRELCLEEMEFAALAALEVELPILGR